MKMSLRTLDDLDMRRMSAGSEAFVLRKLAESRRLDALIAEAAAARVEFIATEPRTAAVRARIAAALGRPS